MGGRVTLEEALQVRIDLGEEDSTRRRGLGNMKSEDEEKRWL